MISIEYDPLTKVFRIVENGYIKEGRFNIFQVFQMLHNYVIRTGGS